MPSLPKTIEELYCASHKATREQFRKRTFWKCLRRRAIPLAPAILVLDRGYFAPDREMIAYVGMATTMAQVQDELRDYFLDSQNRRWLREHLKVRVSSRRVLRFASECLSLAQAPSPKGEGEGSASAPLDPSRRKTRKLKFAGHKVA
jgi:hypothetical protein